MEEKYYISTSENSDSLTHYGIMGMKWGIRRFQNKDGTLTPEGKKRAYAEYKEDNKTAYELGKKATIYGRATVKAADNAAKADLKAEKALESDPYMQKKSTQKKVKASMIGHETAMAIAEKSKEYTKQAEEHCKSLVDKYGEDLVKDIKYKDIKFSKEASNYMGIYDAKQKTVNERTNSPLAIAASIGATAVSVGLVAYGQIPASLAIKPTVAFVVRPTTANEKARQVYTNEKYAATKRYNRAEVESMLNQMDDLYNKE